ncbi:Immunity protein Imm1 [Lentzea albidocapillata subsp. violacea]|uniref:Immunity protein Imm1 n=1 Tax=Lentzea albidocapillata subsp. violacea TaxID=128104 RepID=A0A1G8WUI7_9PSEU|nr:Imm1 family immunity protein [Lentzea albidocapillata]SDJ81260.1 Immunity protein Imm1 [Lentzea albidocapillata subsp. violacea]
MSYVLEASYKHGAGVSLLRTNDDIDGFLTELINAGPDYQSATVYAVDESADEDPTHELVVGVDQAGAFGAVRYAGDDGEWFSKGAQVNPDGVRYLYYGTAHEFPADSEVPLELVRQALGQLLVNEGTRPEGLSWQAATELR